MHPSTPAPSQMPREAGQVYRSEEAEAQVRRLYDDTFKASWQQTWPGGQEGGGGRGEGGVRVRVRTA